MIDKDLAKFISMADDHYWDSLEKERDIIIQHINAIAIEVIKNNCEEYNKTLELTEEGQRISEKPK